MLENMHMLDHMHSPALMADCSYSMKTNNIIFLKVWLQLSQGLII